MIKPWTNDTFAVFVKASKACRKHAAKCRECYMPIIDDEGNPGYLSECCKEGYLLLTAYMDSENRLITTN
jgi:hypothetical protein